MEHPDHNNIYFPITPYQSLRSHTFQNACVSGLLGAFIPKTQTGTLRSLIQQSTPAFNRTLLQTVQLTEAQGSLTSFVNARHTYLQAFPDNRAERREAHQEDLTSISVPHFVRLHLT